MSRITNERKISFSKIRQGLSCINRSATSQSLFISVRQYQIFLLLSVISFILTVLGTAIYFINSSMIPKSAIRKYFQTLQWTPLPIGVGFALIGFQQYRHTRKREANKLLSEPCQDGEAWEIKFYKFLPLRHFSRVAGWFTNLSLPEWSRHMVLGSYVKYFGCNMQEAIVEDLHEYRCLSELFRRKIKPSVRPICPVSSVISPVDGTVLNAGKVDCGTMHQIKGVSYSAKKFLGPNCWNNNVPTVIRGNDDSCYHNSCLQDPRKNDLYHVTIYLAPGDYHRFHSPADWSVNFRRHFPGELLSVNPAIVQWVKDVFVVNERVAYIGNWTHGFMSMTAVGATNVGSVAVPFDRLLRTNVSIWNKFRFFDWYFPKDVSKRKGDEFGEFNLGSTIVLIFEAPKNSKFYVEPGQKIKLGEPLFT